MNYDWMMIHKMKMICTCDIDGLREAEQAKIRALEALGLLDESQLARCLILSFPLEIGGCFSVHADQWFAVVLRLSADVVYDVECDDPLDGIVAIWNALSTRVPITNATDARARSSALLDAYVAAEVSASEHSIGCDDCAAGKRCETQRSLDNAECLAKEAVYGRWGAPQVDESPSFYGVES